MKISKRSRKQERDGAARFGGRTTPGSGNQPWVKNDVRTDELSIEYKFTDKESYSLKSGDLVKAEKNALLDGGREMVFIIELKGREWAVISRDYLEELLST